MSILLVMLKKRTKKCLNSLEDYSMEEKNKLFKAFNNPASKVTNVVTEEVTTDSKLELNPAIKDKNFFEDDVRKREKHEKNKH